jgi:uncharacterized protein
MHPHTAPFLYVFDWKFMRFLSTKWSRKVEHFRQNQDVTVEEERYSPREIMDLRNSERS